MTNIRRLTRYISVLGDQDEVVFEYKNYVQEFDKHQNCTKEIEFNTSGEIDNASRYKFNDRHQLIEEIHYFNDDEVGELIRYKLNEAGKTEEIETVYADDAKSVKKIHRTERLLTIKTYDEDGQSEGEESVRFDQDGRPVEEIQKDEDGKVLQRSVYTYGDNGQVESRVNYGDKDEFLVNTRFDYDDEGHLVKLVQLNEKGKLISSSTYEYDKRGNQILVQNNRHIQRTAYDENNRMLTQETMSRANNLVEDFTEYKYDDQGLLVEERTFKIGEPHQLQPNVFSRTNSNLTRTRYKYEFYEPAD